MKSWRPTLCAATELPDLEAGVAAIRGVLKTLPSRPGVYRMQDARGDVLYVGKARTLKNRVTNYTQVTGCPSGCSGWFANAVDDHCHDAHGSRGAAARSAADQTFRPAYNVLLRDDKSFPFILLREITNSPASRSTVVRVGSKANIMGRSQAPDRSSDA